jgi:hypothetical protein
VSTIADIKALVEAWTPVYCFEITTKDGVTHYWATRSVTFNDNEYEPVILDCSSPKIDLGLWGIEAVPQISITLNNADKSLNGIIVPGNWQGAIIVARFLFFDGVNKVCTSDSKVYGSFRADLPAATWPKVEFTAHNLLNFARKTIPMSVIARKDRYPLPSTADEREAAYSDPTSPFYALGYSPDHGQGNYKGGDEFYMPADYNGTRDVDGDDGTVCLETIGLSARGGQIGKLRSMVGHYAVPRGTNLGANSYSRAKYGQAIPLIYGTARITPIVLDTGAPTAWNGARLSCLLLCDGVNFAPDAANYGIDSVLAVILPGAKNGKDYYGLLPPWASGDSNTLGSWGYLPGLLRPARNRIPATDLSSYDPQDRDLYSGLAYLAVGYPLELSQEDAELGPQTDVIMKGLKVETWDLNGAITWQWSDNPIWIYIDILKRAGFPSDQIDKDWAFASASYCDDVDSLGRKLFRCNLALIAQFKIADVLRGIRANCRLYTTYGSDGKLQLRIKKTLAEEGSSFTLDESNILRGSDGALMIRKWHKSVLESANTFRCDYQDEAAEYSPDSLTKLALDNIQDIGERNPGDSITTVLGCPSYDQAERCLNTLRYENIEGNEYYAVTASMSLIEAQVGLLGLLTEDRHGVEALPIRIITMAPQRDGSIELTIQKHVDEACSNDRITEPLQRILADQSYTPRSVGELALTEILQQSELNPSKLRRTILVEFPVPPTTFESGFSSPTKISNLVQSASGGAIPGLAYASVCFVVEVCPTKDSLEGLASNILWVRPGQTTDTNKFSFDLALPAEADGYTVRIGRRITGTTSIDPTPGRTYKHSTVSTSEKNLTVEITDISTLDDTSLSPDPRFDHVRFLYCYGTDITQRQLLKDAGRTYKRTITSFTFEPEEPTDADSAITVIAVSANAPDTDFYPWQFAPYASLTIATELPTGPPEELTVWAEANGATVTFHVRAGKNATGITEAEFRAQQYTISGLLDLKDLRTVPEGGTLVHDGDDSYVVTGLIANNTGAVYVIHDSPLLVRWYYAFRLKNNFGWSVWSDGNRTPLSVPDYVDTSATWDSGPPAVWSVRIEDAKPGDRFWVQGGNQVTIVATRPKVNGHLITWCAVQLKDISTGSWRDLAADAGAADTHYDGSAIAHTYDPATFNLSKASGNWADAVDGDLILIDVRGGVFDVNHCAWGQIGIIDDTHLYVSHWQMNLAFAPTGGVYPDLRVKIVKPPYQWATEGYLSVATNFYYEEWLYSPADAALEEFRIACFPIPAGVSKANLAGRVWFSNPYCVSDDREYSGGYSAAQANSGSGAVLEVLLEMVDCWNYSKATGDFEHIETAVPFDPANYDGAPKYYFEIVAINVNASYDYAVSLKNAANSVIASITIPKSTSTATRFRSSVISSLPSDSYHLYIPQTEALQNVIVYTSRIVVNQFGATKTRLQICIIGYEGLGNANGSYLAPVYHAPTSGLWVISTGINSQFRKIASLFATIPANGWALEVCHGKYSSGTSYVSLFNKTKDLQVTATELSTASGTPTVQSAAFDASAADFDEGDVFEIRDKNSGGSHIYRACLYVTVNPIKQTALFKRIAKYDTAATLDKNRAVAHFAKGYEVVAKDVQATGIITLEDAGAAESGSTSTAIAGSSLTGFSSIPAIKQRGSLSCPSGSRYIAKNAGSVDYVSEIRTIETIVPVDAQTLAILAMLMGR